MSCSSSHFAPTSFSNYWWFSDSLIPCVLVSIPPYRRLALGPIHSFIYISNRLLGYLSQGVIICGSCLFWCLHSPRFGSLEPLQSMCFESFWSHWSMNLETALKGSPALWNGWSGVSLLMCRARGDLVLSFLNRQVPRVPPIVWGEAFCWCCFSSPVIDDFSDCPTVFLDDTTNRCLAPFGAETGTGWIQWFSSLCFAVLDSAWFRSCCRGIQLALHIFSQIGFCMCIIPHSTHSGNPISTQEKLLNLKWGSCLLTILSPRPWEEGLGVRIGVLCPRRAACTKHTPPKGLQGRLSLHLGPHPNLCRPWLGSN